jgi:malate dehydrogenase (oxaloacetate-decarboxylating)
LPPLVRSRELSFHVAIAVAKQAQADGLAAVVSDEALTAAIKAKTWEPVYADYVRLRT